MKSKSLLTKVFEFFVLLITLILMISNNQIFGYLCLFVWLLSAVLSFDLTLLLSVFLQCFSLLSNEGLEFLPFGPSTLSILMLLASSIIFGKLKKISTTVLFVFFLYFASGLFSTVMAEKIELDGFIDLVLCLLSYVIFASIDLSQVNLEKEFNYASTLSLLYLAYLLASSGAQLNYYRWDLLGYSSANLNSIGRIAALSGLCQFESLIFNKKKKMVSIFFFLIATICVLLTGSRGAFLGLIFGAFICIWVSKKMSKKGFFFIVGFVILFLLVFFVSQSSSFNGRFSLQSVLTSGGSGRINLWKTVLLSIFPQHPFFGIGFSYQNVYSTFSAYGLDAGYAHNILLGFLLRGGLLFFCIGCFHIVVSVFLPRKRKTLLSAGQNAVLPFLLSVSLLFIGIGEDVFLAYAYWVCLGVVNNYQLKWNANENR